MWSDVVSEPSAVAAVLEAASKNIGKEEFGFMPTKKIFVTSYHTKVHCQ
jgi:hypothetical protein